MDERAVINCAALHVPPSASGPGSAPGDVAPARGDGRAEEKAAARRYFRVGRALAAAWKRLAGANG